MGLIVPNIGPMFLEYMKIANNSKIGAALFTKTQQRVLGILFGNTRQSYYLNEIVRIARVGKGSVMRELQKLDSANLILLEKRGNQNHYRANPQSAVFLELSGIIQKTVAAHDLLRSSLLALTEELHQAFMYGPCAVDDQTDNSEINLVLVSDRLTQGHVKQVVKPAEHSIGRKINFVILTEQEYAQRILIKQSFIGRIMEQPKIWLLEKES